MASIISCQNLSKAYGTHPLFQGVSLSVFDNERVGMIGPNGTGKSTFLKILAGLEEPDDGEVVLTRGRNICYLAQSDDFEPGAHIRDILIAALKDDHSDHHEKEIEADMMIATMEFANPESKVKELSGGWRKRLAIACELIKKPDLLLLDEPTNHLDLEGVIWLEDLLRQASFASLAVSHDRYFLESFTKRVVEFNRRYKDGHFTAAGSYSDFLVAREEYFAREERHEETLANKVRREVDWLRRGPKARTTKAKGRINEAYNLIDDLNEVKTRNAQTKTAQIDFVASDRQTKKLIAGESIKKSLGGKLLFENLNFKLSPGVRLGLLGMNGSGKTTLLKIISNELKADAGKIERADNVRVVLFDQNREQLDTTQTLRRALTPYGDQVIYRDRPLHVATWAKRFLFSVDQLEMPVAELSGGERARILIARLMLQPADVLILDEPTNDLDIPTLEVLEESLTEFPGALVLVTHDRYMLDRISTTLLSINGDGTSTYYADYEQWQTAQKSLAKNGAKQEEKKITAPASPAQKSKKLTFKEQFELDKMEENIFKAEEILHTCQAEMNSPEVISNPIKLTDVCARLGAAQNEVDKLYKRWTELEEKLK